VPQLPIRNRYSEYWTDLWWNKLLEEGVNVEVYQPKKPKKIDRSKPYNYFTNAKEALEFELEQLSYVLKRIDSHDSVFFLDGDFPGLCTPFTQVAKLIKPSVKAYIYLHSGSWCSGDIFCKAPGKPMQEKSMLQTFDKVFVATKYHKRKIEEYYQERFGNIKVVGFPFYRDEFISRAGGYTPFQDKEGIFITGRVEQSIWKLSDEITKKFSDYNTIMTQNQIKSVDEYYKVLGESKVVVSLKREETFGLSVVEAMALGCLPLCPDKFSYPETVGKKQCLYSSKEDLLEKLECLLARKKPMKFNLEKWERTIGKVVKEVVKD